MLLCDAMLLAGIGPLLWYHSAAALILRRTSGFMPYPCSYRRYSRFDNKGGVGMANCIIACCTRACLTQPLKGLSRAPRKAHTSSSPIHLSALELSFIVSTVSSPAQ
ncbi:hypothetical protein F5J12DRAFT_521349 [Pisolithus orientalis]|uniref:uncharacterized protein n=1 Tax=Pisolithus orientalis TaxID=936130 RepID=UPI002225AE06|nr:uncharacterized protein F5J12DRAFT_521349 [Pisolithus orientalis]KAI6015199.1 hypothetical protein F5J12DRAFT_521349 [Pisolithus orientalis]